MLTKVIVRVIVLASVVAVGGGFGSLRFGSPGFGSAQPLVQTKSQLSQPTTPEVAPTAAVGQAQNEQTPADIDTIRRLFAAGNEALKAERFDEAITAYRQALELDPDELSLFANLSDALRRRGTKLWNDGARATDPNVKAQAQNAAKQDWAEAAATAFKSLQAINNRVSRQQPIKPEWKIKSTDLRATAMRLVATRVDKSRVDEAWNAYLEHIALLSDPAKKLEMKVEALQVLYGAGAFEKAERESRAVLKEYPEDPGVMLVLGLTLYATRDKAKFAEARIYLQRYLDKAEDTDPFKKGALRTLEALKKAEENKE